MHASISWIFVSDPGENIFRSINGRNVGRSRKMALAAMGIWFSLCSAPTWGQGSYLGKWNSRTETEQGDRIPKLGEPHNRTFRPFQDQQNETLRSLSDLSSPQPETLTQAETLRASDDMAMIIPETPTENSFTELENSIYGSSILESDSGIEDGGTFTGGQTYTLEDPSLSNSSIVSSSPEQASVDLACRWMEQYSVVSGANSAGSSFSPIALVDLLRQPVADNQRSEMIIQYWEAWSQWAELNSRIQFLNWLKKISTANSPADAQFFSTSKQQAENQILEAKSLLNNAQSRLQSFMLHVSPRPNAAMLRPLPADKPLIHPYVTNYRLYQNYHSMPERFQNIDQDLQNCLNQIAKQAQTVESAKSTAEAEFDRYQGGQVNLNSVIAAGQNWRLAEMNLIRTVALYNQKIADYSLNVIHGRHSPETLAAILIGKSGNKREIAGGNLRPESDFLSVMQPPPPQNETQNSNRQFEPPKSILPGASGLNTPVSSSMAPVSSSMEQRFGNQPASARSRYQSGDEVLNENASASSMADPFRPGASVKESEPQPFGSQPARNAEGRLSSDAWSSAATKADDWARRPSPEPNDGQPANPRSTHSDKSARTMLGAGPGVTGDFRPSSNLTDFDRDIQSSGAARSANPNPLKPFNPNAANPSTANPSTANPSTANPNSGIPNTGNPKEAGPAANPNGSGNQSNPPGGMFRPIDFNPSTQPPVNDGNRNSSPTFNPLPNTQPESGVTPILPPENSSRSDGNQDPQT